MDASNEATTNPGWRMRRVRELAKKERLIGVDHLDANGSIGARGNDVKTIRLRFEESVIEIGRREFGMLKDVEFKLRQAEE